MSVRNYHYSLNVFKKLPLLAQHRQGITTTRCVITQKNPGRISFAAEAWSHAHFTLLPRIHTSNSIIG